LLGSMPRRLANGFLATTLLISDVVRTMTSVRKPNLGSTPFSRRLVKAARSGSCVRKLTLPLLTLVCVLEGFRDLQRARRAPILIRVWGGNLTGRSVATTTV